MEGCTAVYLTRYETGDEDDEEDEDEDEVEEERAPLRVVIRIERRTPFAARVCASKRGRWWKEIVI